MSSEINIKSKLEKIRKLINLGRVEEAIKVLQNLQKNYFLEEEDELTALLLRSHIFLKERNFKESLAISDRVLTKTLKKNYHLLSLNSSIIKIKSLFGLNHINEALSLVYQTKNSLKGLKNSTNTKINFIEPIESSLLQLEGVILYNLGEDESALKSLNQSLQIEDETIDKIKLAETYYNIGLINQSKNNINEANIHFTKSLEIDKECKNTYGIANNLYSIGRIKLLMNDVESAEKDFLSGLNYFTDLNEKFMIALLLRDLGKVNVIKDDSFKALDYYNQSILIFEEMNNKIEVAETFLYIVILSSEINPKTAEIFLERLNELNLDETEEYNQDLIKIFSSIGSAIFLANSGRLITKAKAMKNLLSILSNIKDLKRIQLIVLAYIINFLILEVQSFNSKEALDNLSVSLDEMGFIAEKLNLGSVLEELYELNAKVLILQNNSREIAGKLKEGVNKLSLKGFNHLSKKLINFKDNLLNIILLNENILSLDNPLTEKLKIVPLEFISYKNAIHSV